jgi:hypothetical protein
MVFECIHLYVFSLNGKGVEIVDIFSSIFGLTADFATSFCLLLVASGWTLTYINLDWNYMDTLIPAGMLTFGVNFMVGALSFINRKSHSHHHDLSGVHGYVLMAMKIGIALYFIHLSNYTSKKIPTKGKPFFNSFYRFGLMFLLSIPISMIVSFGFATYNRHTVVTIGTVIFHTISLSLLIV